MNLPNRLTLMRMAMVPVFIVFFYAGQYPAFIEPLPTRLASAIAALVFALASATDALDGHIARKRGLITNFGKLMDPLADKVLTAAAFVCFVDVGIMPAWMLVVILAREFAITGLRAVAASEGVVIAAGFSGKLKTVSQMVAIVVLLIGCSIAPDGAARPAWAFFSGAGQALLYVSVALTVYSGVEYLWNGRKLLNMK